MIESNLPLDGANTHADETGLRPLDWSALRARFGAAHDLRGAFASHRRTACGNFARFAAGAREKLNETARGINPDASADRKHVAAIVPGMANDEPPGHREYE